MPSTIILFRNLVNTDLAISAGRMFRLSSGCSIPQARHSSRIALLVAKNPRLCRRMAVSSREPGEQNQTAADKTKGVALHYGATVPDLGSRTSGQVRLMVLLAMMTSMRIGEILGLRWRRVDLQSGIICIMESCYRGTFSTGENPKVRAENSNEPNCPGGATQVA